MGMGESMTTKDAVFKSGSIYLVYKSCEKLQYSYMDSLFPGLEFFSCIHIICGAISLKGWKQ